MNVSRRALFRLAAGGAALPLLPRIAMGQAYPGRPVKMVVGFAAGSSSDIIGRLIGKALSERLGQPVVVENRGGAGGTLGAEEVVRAPADGHTLLLCSSADAVNATLYDKLNYNFLRDIAPVAGVSRGPLVLVVHPSLPAKTIPEFIAYAKANPGKIDFGSAGVGTVAHMAGELFMAEAGVKLVHVPYRGLGPAMTDLLGGQVQAIFSTTPPAIGHVKAGKLRALAVTSKARSQVFPDLPTIGQYLAGYEATLLTGVGAPRNTPSGIIARLNKEIIAALADPAITARLVDLGNEPVAMPSAEFGKVLAEETEKWGRVIRSANIHPS
jgi:tripartite-type tricarboxylate transporter receptor subunit TctC